LQALVPTGKAIIETTANGFNEGKELWDRSVLGESGFKPLFYNAEDFYSKSFLEEKKKNLGKDFINRNIPAIVSKRLLHQVSVFLIRSLARYLKEAKEPMKEGIYVQTI
jgi:hypothetical protein